MDELTQDIGIELHTESIIHRAEQLARLESDKIVDKVSWLLPGENTCKYTTLVLPTVNHVNWNYCLIEFPFFCRQGKNVIKTWRRLVCL